MQKPKPIAFETQIDFENRPNYQASLSCEEAELDYIVGTYHFGKQQRLQCGLNNCNQWHQKGFVIATKSGKETHCGNKCGANAFGIAWEEIKADYKKKEEASNRFASLQRIQDEAKTALNRCIELSTKCEPLATKIKAISKEMSLEEAFKRALDESIKIGGKIYGKVERSSFMSDGINRTELKATIEGGEAVSASASIMNILKFQVQHPLNNVLGKDLQTYTEKEIETELAALKNYTATLLKAETFIRYATRFTAVSNLKKIGLLIDNLSKNSRTGRVHRIAAKICTIT